MASILRTYHASTFVFVGFLFKLKFIIGKKVLRQFRLKMELFSGIKLDLLFWESASVRSREQQVLQNCFPTWNIAWTVHTCKNISLDEKSKHGCLCLTFFISKEIKLYFDVMMRVTNNQIHTYLAETFYSICFRKFMSSLRHYRVINICLIYGHFVPQNIKRVTLLITLMFVGISRKV